MPDASRGTKPTSLPGNESKASAQAIAQLQFRGGPVLSILPLFFFVCATVVMSLLAVLTAEAMIVAAMLGISAGMLFAKDITKYSESIFTLMANRIVTVAIVCWLWAGAFSGILGASGLVEAFVWIGWKLNLYGAWLTVGVFLSAALFATSVGTSLGTMLGFTAVLYPAGTVLGANPAVLIGAIISGAALGDNLSPISDTTIVSAATQETDVGGVVRSRLKYVLLAAGLSSILFYIFGAADTAPSSAEGHMLLAQIANPRGLPMLIPPVLVFVMAIAGYHFLGALTVGLVSATIIGPATGTIALTDIVSFSDGVISGSAVSGTMALVPTSVLALLLVTSIGVMQAGGFLVELIEWSNRNIAKSVRGAEFAILALISFTNLFVSVNTVAMIAAGPLANILRKRFGIHPYRTANLLDTVSCSFHFLLPYASTVVAAIAIQGEVAQRYDFVEVLTTSQFVPFAFYCIILYPLMIIAVATGFGRKKG